MLSKAKASGKSQKDQSFDWCITGPLKDIELPKTKTGNWKSFVYDMVDSYVLARAGVVQENRKKN